eukprot:scaffold16826_cov477-Ochromonas_danica.AAC.1
MWAWLVPKTSAVQTKGRLSKDMVNEGKVAEKRSEINQGIDYDLYLSRAGQELVGSKQPLD